MAEAKDGLGLEYYDVEEMVASGIIVKTPDKPGKGHKSFSDKDRAQLEQMVKGLSKFRLCEEEVDEDGELKKKSDGKSEKKLKSTKMAKDGSSKAQSTSGSLADYLQAEMSTLNPIETSVAVDKKGRGSSENKTDMGLDVPKKSSVKISSVSPKMQKEFLFLHEEHVAKTKEALDSSIPSLVTNMDFEKKFDIAVKGAEASTNATHENNEQKNKKMKKMKLNKEKLEKG